MDSKRPQPPGAGGVEVDARVLVAASSKNMNLYYATRFLAGDPFMFIDTGSRTYIVVSDLEMGRACTEARVDEILGLSEFRSRAAARGIATPRDGDVLAEVLRELDVERILVPHDFPVGIADRVRESEFDVIPCQAGHPFLPERVIKSEDEIDFMRAAMRANEKALRKGIDTIAAATIDGDRLYLDSEPLTSERVRAVIDTDLFLDGYLASRTIVAGGDQACDPHAEGSGLLPAHKPIIIDVFPRSMRTRYCADMTRTVVRGAATPRVRAMYDAVLEAQSLAFESLRAGVDGSHVHKRIEELFVRRGFRTGPASVGGAPQGVGGTPQGVGGTPQGAGGTPQGAGTGRMEGFFHGSGHGLGLEIHELPAFGKRPYIFESGMVVTVEPGLYYPGEGGVRIEDVVVIRDNGIENICTLEKTLEI